MQLALFDLDHTLIPFDSGSVFTSFLIERGALPPAFAEDYLGWCRQYAAGQVDMVAMHRYTVGALAVHPPARLQAWLDEFAAGLPARIPQDAHALLRMHRDAGHACLLVTATSRLVSAPFAAALGFDAATELLATEPQRDAAGRLTGEIDGAPCFREHKVARVGAWLAARGQGWDTPARSWFYSDSMNDLPLLEQVSDPVAVNADPRLAALAAARGWPQRRIG
ncbi:HAD family hydrolase [Piscinibacter sakaiensis]|uniref:Phosphoserine phosphatase n=1 Tax=Piscinibacter sakaiensis TaxID=1547922 RepID=A0A0K8P8N8_PISS1|nr:HAD-IB family hydrolase [Piscinibacter sakaiensis]GAP39007.1 phosphoserine phosphatase [Piscinibacter sakaiensis]